MAIFCSRCVQKNRFFRTHMLLLAHIVLSTPMGANQERLNQKLRPLYTNAEVTQDQLQLPLMGFVKSYLRKMSDKITRGMRYCLL